MRTLLLIAFPRRGFACEARGRMVGGGIFEIGRRIAGAASSTPTTFPSLVLDV
ncbi:Unannotated [Lentimonas sp. CC19]|nr:Unannotated [Lentimonas sp. CC10]CAA6694702.1 Unannotated [Lentimonas sp. CC19]CAA7071447.1 Unannotated [Lentimonas sp. CC11]